MVSAARPKFFAFSLPSPRPRVEPYRASLILPLPHVMGGAFVPFRRNMQVPTCVPPRCSHFCFAAQLCGIKSVRSSFAYACRSAGDEQLGRAAKHERRRAPALLDLAGMVFGSHDSPRGRLRSGADGFGTGPPFGATRSSFTLITPLEYLWDMRHSC